MLETADEALDTQLLADNIGFLDQCFDNSFTLQNSLSLIKEYVAEEELEVRNGRKNEVLSISCRHSTALQNKTKSLDYSTCNVKLAFQPSQCIPNSYKVPRNLKEWGLPFEIVKKYEQKGISDMFDWQVSCLSNSKILIDCCNLVYSAPTSAGKTLVAEILTIKTVLERQKKVIVILPFVSIVREKMFYFQDILSSSGIRVEGFMGSQSPPGGLQAVHVAICTIEKANSLINKLLDDNSISDLGAVIVDELHLLGDPHRGYILELLLTKVKYVSSKLDDCQIQVIGMSATLPNLDVLSQWLDAELFVTQFRPIPLDEYCLIGNKYYDKLGNYVGIIDSVKMGNSENDNVLNICLDTIKDGCSILIFCMTKNRCESLAQNISSSFYKLGCSSNTFGLILREQLNSEKILEVLEQLKNCPVGIDHILKTTVSFGVAYHHAGLTFDERDIIEGGFKSGAIRVLVATSTLSSGVNLPARKVIIRTPVFQRQPINILTYKQMIGRAGRMGKDTKGESILICTEAEKKIGLDLMMGSLEPVRSCIESEDKYMRAILEMIASQMACTKNDLELYSKCTLLCTQDNITPSQSSLLKSTIEQLKNFELVRIQNCEDEEKYVATPLGKACLSSSMAPNDGLSLFCELQRARQCLVLETDLHLIYLVTPYSVSNQWANIDWLHMLTLWESLTKAMKKVGELVGVQESFIIRCLRGTSKVSHDQNKLNIHKRFYTALALQHLVNEVPLSEVSSNFRCARGFLQGLQQASATFAGMVTAFCHQLGWKNMELLISQFQDRLHFGIHSELLELMKLTSLNGTRARTLYNAGYETIASVASADVNDIENALHKAVPFQSEKEREDDDSNDTKKRNKIKNIWVTGHCGLTTKEAAENLILEARKYLEYEIGVTEIKWHQMAKTPCPLKIDQNVTNVEYLQKHKPCIEHEINPQSSITKCVKQGCLNREIIGIGNQEINKQNMVKNATNVQKYIGEEARNIEDGNNIFYNKVILNLTDTLNINNSAIKGKKSLIQSSTSNVIEYEKFSTNENEELIDENLSVNDHTETKYFTENFLCNKAIANAKAEETDVKDFVMNAIVVDRSVSKYLQNDSLERTKTLTTNCTLANVNNYETFPINVKEEMINDNDENNCVKDKYPSNNRLCNNTFVHIKTEKFDDMIEISSINKKCMQIMIDQETPDENSILKNDFIWDTLNLTEVSFNTIAKDGNLSKVCDTNKSKDNSRNASNSTGSKTVLCKDASLFSSEGDNSSLFEETLPVDLIPSKLLEDKNTKNDINTNYESDSINFDSNILENAFQSSVMKISEDEDIKLIYDDENKETRYDSPIILDVSDDVEVLSTLEIEIINSPLKRPVEKNNSGTDENDPPSAKKIKIGWSSTPCKIYNNKVQAKSQIKTKSINSKLFTLQIENYAINCYVLSENDILDNFHIIENSEELSMYLDIRNSIPSETELIGRNALRQPVKNGNTNYKYSLNGIAFYTANDTCFYLDIASLQDKAFYFNSKLHKWLEKKTSMLMMMSFKVNFIHLKQSFGFDLPSRCLDICLSEWLIDTDERIPDIMYLTKKYCGMDIKTILFRIDGTEKRFKYLEKVEALCVKAWSVFVIAKQQKKYLCEKYHNFTHILNTEMQVLKILATCEYFGVTVDKDLAAQLLIDVRTSQEIIKKKAYKICGYHFNFNSSKDVAKVLGMYKGRKVSTKKSVLSIYNSPMSNIIMHWRKLNSILTKTLYPLTEKASFNRCDNRISPSYNIYTCTGRISMHEPNLQNVPRTFSIPAQYLEPSDNREITDDVIEFNCRNIFRAAPHHILVSADYCQLEMRILTHYSEDVVLSKIMKSDMDVFKSIAASWAGVSEKEVDDDLRQRAKQLCYGILYGMGNKTLGQHLDVGEMEAAVFMDSFYKTYPAIRVLTQKIIEDCKRNGYVETLMKRRRYLPDINSNVASKRSAAERQAVNTTIQGSAADIAKAAMCAIDNRTLGGEKPRLILQMHDELIYEVPEVYKDSFSSIIKDVMENTLTLNVPLPVKVKAGYTWGSLKEVA